MPLEHDPQYTVVLRGTRFNLTSSQINFDGPNYLTSCFLGDSRESQTRILELPRSPDLFPIIMDYLCGYVVLPLDTSKLSSSSICYPEEKAVKNLRADADFYKLEGLKKVCDDYLTEPPKRTSKECIVIGIRYPRSDENDLVAHIRQEPLESFVTSMEREKFDEDIRPTLTTPASCSGFSGLRLIGTVEQAIKRPLEEANYSTYRRWDVIGWNSSSLPDGTQQVHIAIEEQD